MDKTLTYLPGSDELPNVFSLTNLKLKTNLRADMVCLLSGQRLKLVLLSDYDSEEKIVTIVAVLSRAPGCLVHLCCHTAATEWQTRYLESTSQQPPTAESLLQHKPPCPQRAPALLGCPGVKRIISRPGTALGFAKSTYLMGQLCTTQP